MKQTLLIGAMLLTFLLGCDGSKQDAAEQKVSPKNLVGITLGPSSMVANVDFGCGPISRTGETLEINGKELKIKEKDTIEVSCTGKNTVQVVINGKKIKFQ